MNTRYLGVLTKFYPSEWNFLDDPSIQVGDKVTWRQHNARGNWQKRYVKDKRSVFFVDCTEKEFGPHIAYRLTKKFTDS